MAAFNSAREEKIDMPTNGAEAIDIIFNDVESNEKAPEKLTTSADICEERIENIISDEKTSNATPDIFADAKLGSEVWMAAIMNESEEVKTKIG